MNKIILCPHCNKKVIKIDWIDDDSQGKKDSPDSPNEDYLATRSTTGEDHKSGQMPVKVRWDVEKDMPSVAEKHPDTNQSREEPKSKWGRTYGKLAQSELCECGHEREMHSDVGCWHKEENKHGKSECICKKFVTEKEDKA